MPWFLGALRKEREGTANVHDPKPVDGDPFLYGCCVIGEKGGLNCGRGEAGMVSLLERSSLKLFVRAV
jgi:hypothetical protein